MSDPMDLARKLYDAINRSDAVAAGACYHPSCVVEHAFIDDAERIEGRPGVEAAWAREFVRYRGAAPGGDRYEVHRISGIETGWGWARADWRRLVRDAEGREHAQNGYSHFWVEDGGIRRQRSMGSHLVLQHRPGRQGDVAKQDVTPSPREYPSRPIVGVGAVILSEAGEVVLVKRRYEPLAGQWSLPGGTQELGEALETAVAREVTEETGLVVDVGPLVEVFDRILSDEQGRVRFHYVIADYLCRPREGRLAAGGDVSEAVFADPGALGPYRLTEKAVAVIRRAVEIEMDMEQAKERPS